MAFGNSILTGNPNRLALKPHYLEASSLSPAGVVLLHVVEIVLGNLEWEAHFPLLLLRRRPLHFHAVLRLDGVALGLWRLAALGLGVAVLSRLQRECNWRWMRARPVVSEDTAALSVLRRPNKGKKHPDDDVTTYKLCHHLRRKMKPENRLIQKSVSEFLPCEV